MDFIKSKINLSSCYSSYLFILAIILSPFGNSSIRFLKTLIYLETSSGVFVFIKRLICSGSSKPTTSALCKKRAKSFFVHVLNPSFNNSSRYFSSSSVNSSGFTNSELSSSSSFFSSFLSLVSFSFSFSFSLFFSFSSFSLFFLSSNFCKYSFYNFSFSSY